MLIFYYLPSQVTQLDFFTFLERFLWLESSLEEILGLLGDLETLEELLGLFEDLETATPPRVCLSVTVSGDGSQSGTDRAED